MDATRSDNVVDTPAPELLAKTPDIPWPSREMFLDRNPLTNWNDLPLGIFFINERIDSCKTDFGLRSKLHLHHKNGDTFWIWGFDQLVKQLDKYPKTMFILNKGVLDCFDDNSPPNFLLY